MAIESTRGCGFRKVGGLYLCGRGLPVKCDRMPYPLELCPVCGAGVKFTRGWTWLNWDKYAGVHITRCRCLYGTRVQGSSTCPICMPSEDNQPYGLLWVGEASYTPQSFIQEALIMGVSRRIAAIPKNLKLNKTWVLFAHKRLIDNERPGVFYAFRPQSLELLIWQSEAKPEYLEDLAKRNITPIITPDGDEDHHPDSKTKMSADDREAVTREHTIAVLRNKIGR